MTLYMHEQGPVSFAALRSPADVQKFFAEYYPSAVPLMPQYVDDFMANPVGFLGTVFVSPWVYQDKFALIGDAVRQACGCEWCGVCAFLLKQTCFVVRVCLGVGG